MSTHRRTIDLILSATAGPSRRTALASLLAGLGLAVFQSTARANLLLNADFGTGDATDWFPSGGVGGFYTGVNTGAGVEPGGTGYPYLLGIPSNPFGELDLVSQAVSTIPGKTYDVSYWLYTGGFMDENGGIFFASTSPLSDLSDLNTNNGIPDTYALPGSFVSGSEPGLQPWAKYTTSFVATSNSTLFTFAGATNSLFAGKVGDFDIVAPEPSSMALLAVVAAGLFARRRRAPE